MYARSTTVRGAREAVDEGIAYVRDEVMPAVRGLVTDGLLLADADNDAADKAADALTRR